MLELGLTGLKLAGMGFALSIGFYCGNSLCHKTSRWFKVHNPGVLAEARRAAKDIARAQQTP